MDIRDGDLFKVILLRLFDLLPWKTDVQNLGLLCRYAAQVRRMFYLNFRVMWVINADNHMDAEKLWTAVNIRPMWIKFPDYPYGSKKFGESFRRVCVENFVVTNLRRYAKRWPNLVEISCKLGGSQDIVIPEHIHFFTHDIVTPSDRVITVHDKVVGLAATNITLCRYNIDPFSMLKQLHIAVADIHLPVLPDTVETYELTLDHSSIDTLHLKLPRYLKHFVLKTICKMDNESRRGIYFPTECRDSLEVLKIRGVVFNDKNYWTESRVYLPAYRNLDLLELDIREVTFLDGLVSLGYVKKQLSIRLATQGAKLNFGREVSFEQMFNSLNSSLSYLRMESKTMPVGVYDNVVRVHSQKLPHLETLELSLPLKLRLVDVDFSRIERLLIRTIELTGNITKLNTTSACDIILSQVSRNHDEVLEFPDEMMHRDTKVRLDNMLLSTPPLTHVAYTSRYGITFKTPFFAEPKKNALK
mgnify:CR=1 FL=1